MNFKKTLVALAMAGFASGAMASDVQLDNGIWTLSAEGIQAGVKQDMQTVAGTTGFDFFLDKEISASGTVSIKFDEGFEFDATAVNVPTSAINGTTDVVIGSQTLKIRYGSASFTFVQYAWEQASQTLTLTLGNGQPLLGGASFGLEFPASIANMVDVASVNVTTNKFDGTQIETFDKTVSQTATQFVISTDLPMTGTVDVANRGLFLSGAVGTDASDVKINKYGTLNVVDRTDYKAAATVENFQVNLVGEFAKVDGTTPWSGSFDMSTATDTITATKAKIVKTIASGDILGLSDPKVGTNWPIEYTAVAADGSLVTPFSVSAELKVKDIDENITFLNSSAFGSWDLEDGVINVPYLPVGFPGLSANVEISNESTKDATIYVEAFNQEGEYFAQVELAQVAAGQTVTKVSAQDLINAFGLTGKNKLSVTFSFDIEGVEGAEGITLAPYYRQNESRINVLSDEYKGK